MMLFEYQEKAIKELYEKIEDIIDIYEVKKKKNKDVSTSTIHFTSPTGSGKTIMSFALMEELIRLYNNLVFIWIAPNTLHSQSLNKFENLTDVTISDLNPIDSDGIDSDNILKPNDILCLNWSSIDKKSNTLIKGNEYGINIDNIIELTKNDGQIIITLIDESHIASQNDKTKAYEFLKKLNPTVKVDITATPKKIELGDEKIEVSNKEVIKAGVIKKQFIFNAFEDENIDNRKLTQYAYNKLREITKKYQEHTNDKIIPLMIIQIENEKSDDYRKVQYEIERYLEEIGINIKEEVAYYLSDDKDKSENLALNNNPIQIVFTKTAIATGWDCPRASVLLTFRKSNDDKFKTQVLGRINRMPELRHYDEDLLDTAYVFANASKYIPDDPNKFKVKTKQQANDETVLIKPKTQNIISIPFFTKDDVIEKYYDSEFDMKKYVVKRCESLINEIDLTSTDITYSILQNLKIDTLKDIQISETNTEYILTSDEIEALMSSIFVKSGYEPILLKKQLLLFEVKKDLFPFETINLLKIIKEKLEENSSEEYSYLNIYKIILKEENYEKFILLLSDIKNESFKKRLSGLSSETLFTKLEERNRWSPEKSFICDSSRLLKLTKKSFYKKDCLKDFNKTEKCFVAFLETTDDIAYWYRNGSRGNYFRVPYKQNNIVREFYPDFITVDTDGKIGIYDTKSEMTASDGEAKDKAEYLYAYCEEFGFYNGLIKIEKIADINYFKINRRANYTNYDKNNVEWEDFGTLADKNNIFEDLEN